MRRPTDFSAIWLDVGNGIPKMRPRDHVHVRVDPRSYTVFGAINANGLYTIDTPTVSVAEAVAMSGGLADIRADSRALYLFRYEPAVVAAALYGQSAKFDAIKPNRPSGV